MDPMIKQTIDGMLSGFDHVTVTDPGVQQEIDDYKKEMNELGEKHTDVMEFMNELQTSGLMEKNGELMTKASTTAPAEQPAAQDNGGGDSGASLSNLPTVTQFLDQYRPNYEMAKTHGYQPRSVALYEEIFKIADRTDDLLEMNIILEEEGYLRRMSSEASFDTYELHLAAQDPNNIPAKAQFKERLELADRYKSDEELYYETDLLVEKNLQESNSFNFRMNLSLGLGKACVDYVLSKVHAWAADEPDVQVPGFILSRDKARKTYELIQKDFGLSFDDIAQDPWSQKWLLVFRPLEALNLGGYCLDPQNIECFREVLFEEILSDKTDIELLQRKPEKVVHFDIDSSQFPEHEQVFKDMEAEVNKRLSSRWYYEYYKKINGADMMKAAEDAMANVGV